MPAFTSANYLSTLSLTATTAGTTTKVAPPLLAPPRMQHFPAAFALRQIAVCLGITIATAASVRQRARATMLSMLKPLLGCCQRTLSVIPSPHRPALSSVLTTVSPTARHTASTGKLSLICPALPNRQQAPIRPNVFRLRATPRWLEQDAITPASSALFQPMSMAPNTHRHNKATACVSKWSSVARSPLSTTQADCKKPCITTPAIQTLLLIDSAALILLMPTPTLTPSTTSKLFPPSKPNTNNKMSY